MTISKHSTSVPRPKRDLTLEPPFGSLVAQRYVGGSRWECLCVCGKTTIVGISSLTSGNTKLCGCQQHKHSVANNYNLSHGLSQHPIYRRWRIMLNRCYNSASEHYPDYGGRGITVCDRWRHSVEHFYTDMGDPPPGMTIERINNNQGYFPENCRWAPQLEQHRNKRSNHLLTYNDETHPISAWGEKLNMPGSILYLRIQAGWSVERALTTPPRVTRRPKGT